MNGQNVKVIKSSYGKMIYGFVINVSGDGVKMTENHGKFIIIDCDKKNKTLYFLTDSGFDLLINGKDFDDLMRAIK